jgi:hypothetical protein
MTIDLTAASDFMASHARLLDRRRCALLFGDDGAEPVLDALAAYANPDGGFGWALHPDLRSTTSQPVGAMHGFEILAEVAPSTSPLAPRLCDWLDQVSLESGALPFAFPFADATGSAPLWGGSDPAQPSFLITAAVCGFAHRVADPAVAEHPWLARATNWCLREMAGWEKPDMAIAFRFGLQLLDALKEKGADDGKLERLGALLPPSASMPVPGGAEGERMRPLDFSPEPGPLREVIGADVISGDLDDLAAEQDAEGGWNVDFQVYSPAAVLEWKGEATVRALRILKANGRLS